MPGKNVSLAAELSPVETVLREELQANVQKLAGEIGGRNVSRYPALGAAADFIEHSFSPVPDCSRDAKPTKSVAAGVATSK